MPTSIPVRPDPSLAEAEAIQRFWEEHYLELLKAYPEQFVAVKDGRVIAAHSDLAMLAYELRDRGLDARTDVAIQFISSRSATLLL